jgi:hypothetical protein
MWAGLVSDPEGRALQRIIQRETITALPAWIAQGVCCRSFCVERILSLEFLLLLFQDKRREEKG